MRQRDVLRSRNTAMVASEELGLMLGRPYGTGSQPPILKVRWGSSRVALQASAGLDSRGVNKSVLLKRSSTICPGN